MPGINQQNQVGFEEKRTENKGEGESELEDKKKEIKEEGESEKKNIAAAVVGRANSSVSSSRSIPLIVNSTEGGWDRGGIKKDAAKHKRISPPSRVSNRSVGSPSVSTFCARYSSSSSPHHTVRKTVSLHTITPTQTLEVLRHDRHPNPLK